MLNLLKIYSTIRILQCYSRSILSAFLIRRLSYSAEERKNFNRQTFLNKKTNQACWKLSCRLQITQ